MAILASISSGAVSTETIAQFSTAAISTIQVGLNVTAVAGTSPSLQPYLEVLGADGIWYAVWKPTAITAAGQTVESIGPGCASEAVFDAEARLRLEVSGTTPSFTLSASVHGRTYNP